MAALGTSPNGVNVADQYLLGNIAPNVDPALIKQHPSDIWKTLYGQLMALGNAKGVPRDRQNMHGELPTPFANIGNAAGVASPGVPGASTAAFAPAASDYVNGEIFIQTGDRLLYPTGEMAVATVGGVPGARTIVLTPIYITVTLPAVTSSARWMVVDNTNNEGFAFNRKGHTPVIEKYGFDLQLIQNTETATISAQSNRTFFNMGEGRMDIAKHAFTEEEKIHTQMVDQAMYIGQSTGNNAGANNIAMTSWDETINTRGYTLQTGAGIPIVLDDLYAMSNYYDSLARPGNEVTDLMCKVAPARLKDLEAIPRTALANGSYIYGQGSNAGDRMVTFGFSSFMNIQGYNYFWSKAYPFSQPDTFGTTGHPFSKSVYIAPMAMTADALTKESSIPMMEMLWMQSEAQGDLRFKVYTAGPEILQAHKTSVTMVSYVGMRFRCGFNFTKITE